jgi:hypothetical protein
MHIKESICNKRVKKNSISQDFIPEELPELITKKMKSIDETIQEKLKNKFDRHLLIRRPAVFALNIFILRN